MRVYYLVDIFMANPLTTVFNNLVKYIEGLPKRVKLKSTYVGEGCPTYFIAEIGNNHNGDFFLAKKLIEESARIGANAVKFQKRHIEEVFAKELRNKPQTKDLELGKTYGEYRQHLELGFDDFVNLKKVAEKEKVTFFATPFDKKSADFLDKVGVDVYKIASFDATNLPLLEYVAKKGKPVILSTGMCTLEELDNAVATVLKHNDKLIILHCISIYPTPDEKISLSTMQMLAQRYAPLPVGYSGHEKGFEPSVAAAALGARCIERHITIDKSLPGPDHATVSLDVGEFETMIQQTRRIEKAIGHLDTKHILDEEKPAREKHSKSLVSKHHIKAGTKITADMIVFKSPGHGFKPYQLPRVVGKRAKTDIPEDTVIIAEHIH